MPANNLFYTIRHCPGSDAVTSKVLRRIKLNAGARIANVFPGTGEQCLLLAKAYKEAHITAIEGENLHFDKIMEKADGMGFGDRILTARSSPDELPFEEESLDLILSEGGFEEMDFSRRLRQWRKFLKPGGYLAMSELCLITDKVLPGELRDYFDNAYRNRELGSIRDRIRQLKDTGYKRLSHFILPDSCWFEHFESLKRGTGKMFAKCMDEELELYLKYKKYFRYVYFTMRRRPLVCGRPVRATRLDGGQRASLRNFLIDKLAGKAFSNTLRYTQWWLTDHIAGKNHGEILEGLRREGGGSDCEVLGCLFRTLVMEGNKRWK